MSDYPLTFREFLAKYGTVEDVVRLYMDHKMGPDERASFENSIGGAALASWALVITLNDFRRQMMTPTIMLDKHKLVNR